MYKRTPKNESERILNVVLTTTSQLCIHNEFSKTSFSRHPKKIVIKNSLGVLYELGAVWVSIVRYCITPIFKHQPFIL